MSSTACSSGHASKNSAGQAMSAIRTIHCGRYWVDLSGTLLCGMPKSAYSRDDNQSDCLSALLANPWFYVGTSAGNMSMISVPWMNRGSLLWSLSTALVFAPCCTKPSRWLRGWRSPCQDTSFWICGSCWEQSWKPSAALLWAACRWLGKQWATCKISHCHWWLWQPASQPPAWIWSWWDPTVYL